VIDTRRGAWGAPGEDPGRSSDERRAGVRSRSARRNVCAAPGDASRCRIAINRIYKSLMAKNKGNGMPATSLLPAFLTVVDPHLLLFVADTLNQNDTTLRFLATSTPRFKPEVNAVFYEWLLPPVRNQALSRSVQAFVRAFSDTARES